MKRLMFLVLVCSALLLGTTYADLMVTLTWDPNTEPDLAGYKVYMRKAGEAYGSPLATLPEQTSYSVSVPQGAVEELRHFALTAYDTSGNESPKSAEVSKLILAQLIKPCTPVLTVSPLSTTSLRVSWPACADGAGQPAKLDVRWSVPPLSWGAQVNPTIPCPASPCTIAGLAPDTLYDVQAVAYRGEPNTASVVYGELSAIASGRTQAAVPPPPPPPPPVLRSTITVTKETSVQHVEQLKIRVKKADCPGLGTATTKSYDAAGNAVSASSASVVEKEFTITCKP